MNLIVPTVAQTSRNTCWHASAQMIWYYWQGIHHRQGPMNTLSANYKSDAGVRPEQFVILAGKTGLKKVNHDFRNYTTGMIGWLLSSYGPLWCAGYWYGVGHIIVLTGVDHNSVYFNDPDGGIRKKEGVAWFNNKLSKTVPGCIMHKDPHAY